MKDSVDAPERVFDLLAKTTEIVTAYVSHNQMAKDDLSGMIRSVHVTLDSLLKASHDPRERASARPVPAVPIDASVTPDLIICLEDGKPFKTLKRHLRTAYNMSPEDYKERWGLSKDYPMVAPKYSAKRSRAAKKSGLGRKPAEN
ncbi:MucR family transcriptional regulator [Pseudoruegeria sp. HB172150]|uniref:MucR family transcriptional regulator n=1 Tax=Pseudoruegeria sp. HB172150 TaxID=2721164 RepID=UPI001552CB04|nr:MucR family transcriptional regulator [Pseudoruegeria sp. HB172150]